MTSGREPALHLQVVPAAVYKVDPAPVLPHVTRTTEREDVGNSGDSFGPHLHYHLQSGPRLFADLSVPVKFENVETQLSRGTYFDPK